MRILVDKKIYSKEVLLKTAYSFTNYAYLHLSQDENGWIVEYIEKDHNEGVMNGFENALIEQQLRESLILQTKDVRKILLARAFASTIIEEAEDKNQADNEPTDAKSTDTLENSNILRGWFDRNDNIGSVSIL